MRLPTGLGACVGALGLAACTSFDLNQGRAYPCQPDASTVSCAPGWVCGLEGLCHDGDAGGPFQCSSGTPCTGGWLCGLENVCHAPDAGAPYLCATVTGTVATNPSDSFCAQGWYCAKLGRCALPGPGEGTVPSFPADASVQIAPVSPLAFWQPPEAVAFSTPFEAGSGSPMVDTQNAALVDSQGLSLLQRTTLIDPGSGGTADSFSFARVPFSQSALAMAATSRLVYVQTPGGLLAVLPDGGGGELHPDVQASFLRQSASTPEGMLLAFDAGVYWVLVEDGGAGFGVSTTGSLPGAGDIVQMTSYAPIGGLCKATWVGLNSSGDLYFSAWSGSVLSGWTQIPLPGLGDAGLVPLDVQVGGRPSLLAEALVDDAGTPYVALWSVGGCGGSATVSPVLAPCPVCSNGLGEIHPTVMGNGTYAVEARCTDGTGPVRLQPDPFDGHCVSFPWSSLEDTQTDDLVAADGVPGAAGYAGAHGQLEFGAALATAAPFTLDQLPTAMIGHDVQLVASSGGERFVWNPQLGAVRTRTELSPAEQLVGSVDGNPWMGLFGDGTIKWALDSDDDVNDGDLDPLIPWSVVAVDLSVIRFQPPFNAAVRDDGAGNVVAVVVANDTLLGVDLLDASPFGPAPLGVKVVPAPGSPITSLALLPGAKDATGTRFISGYVLAQGQVYSFSGATDAPVWSSVPIDTGIPTQDTGGAQDQVSVPTKVFATDTRAMLGLQDGAVYSLPNLLPLAPSFVAQGLTIPDGTGLPFQGWALDYGQACGVVYVSTQDGIYRLQPPVAGQRVGFWVLESAFKGALAPRDPTLSSFSGLNPSRFYGAFDELYLTSAFGSIARLTVAGCGQ